MGQCLPPAGCLRRSATLEHRRATTRVGTADLGGQGQRSGAGRRLRRRRTLTCPGRAGACRRRHRRHADRGGSRPAGSAGSRTEHRELLSGRHHRVRPIPPGSEGRFNTIIDSTLFHSLAAGKPNEVDEEEPRTAVGGYWVIDEVRPAFIRTTVPKMPDAPEQAPPFELDETG